MPTPCPSRLKELIALANLEPDSEARKHLQTIARAFKARRQRKADAPRFIRIKLQQTITVILDDGTIETPRGELELALAEIEPASKIGLIRECPKCLEIFWAGRSDKEACGKEACTRYADALRKRGKRRKDREVEAERNRKLAERIQRRPKEPFELNKTMATILDAIDDQRRTFDKIDWFCWAHLGKAYLKVNVISGLQRLVEFGVLQRDDPEEGPTYYTPRRKMQELRREVFARKPTAHFFRTAIDD